MLISAHDLCKAHGEGSARRTVLGPLSLEIERGEFVAILGPSGSGKSTLMTLFGLLDRPTSGKLTIDGVDTRRLKPAQAAALRSSRIGFVFQAYNLLPRLTARQNVELPLTYLGLPRAQRRLESSRALDQVGLDKRSSALPQELSGGEQQRVAIARALAAAPAIILADEPTGALDTATAQEILALFVALNREGHTILMVTHDIQIAAHARRLVTLRDGRIITDEYGNELRPRIARTSCA